MSFSSLPWFVRREVLNSIVAENPMYCLLGREWMREVGIRHGEVYLDYESPLDLSISPFSPYIERISFHRSYDIDWDTLFLYKNLKHVDIHLSYDDNEFYTEFSSKLEGLSPLSSLQLRITEPRELELYKVLEKSKDHFERFSFSMETFEKFPLNLIFSNLKSLHLAEIKSQFSIQEITRNMPNLNKLNLNCDINFSNIVMPNIVELYVRCLRFKTYTSIELSLFPRLKQLKMIRLLLTSSVSHKNQIESLTIYGNADHIMKTINIPFSNLKVLELIYEEVEKIQGLKNLFQCLTTLTSLTKFNLKVRREMNLLINLPEGPYSFTDLALQGPFLITPHLLTWLSNCSNITHLNLLQCVLNNDVKLPVVPFNSMKSLKITSRIFSVITLKLISIRLTILI